MKEIFDVTGMSCSACSARVDRAVSSVQGVQQVNVNLLKNSMSVVFDENQVTTDAIETAVKEAGYGATLHRSSGNQTSKTVSSNQSENAQDAEIQNMKMRLWVSVIFSVPLMYIAMAPMIGLPNPPFLEGHQRMGVNALTQFVLSIPVLFVNFKFFRNGFKSLFALAPNMDSLVAIGSAASTLFSLFALYMIVIGFSESNSELVMHYAHNLYFDSAAMILTLITLGKFFEARAKRKTTNAISKLLELVPETALVLENGEEKEVPVQDVKVGQFVVLKTGARIPVDGVLKDGGCVVDESSLTGESVPVEKQVGQNLSGATLVTQGHAVMEVTKVGDDTALAQIIRLVDEATSSKAPVSRLADKVSGIFVPTVIAIAILSAVVWMLCGKSWEFALMIAVSVLVISCPCALGLATPTAIMVGSGKGAEHGILFKSAEAIEAGEKITAVVLDKTGTITAGKPTVTDIILKTGADKAKVLAQICAVERKSEHPLAEAIVRCLDPMISERRDANGFSQSFGSVQGKVGNDTIKIGHEKLLNETQTEILNKMRQLSDQGKTALVVLINDNPQAILAIADPVKSDSRTAVEAMQAKNQQVWMVTGDNQRTAKAVAAGVGITNIQSEVLPADKEKVVRELQAQGKRVLMVGDGINDAPALARADIGVAIGNGTDVAIESADVVVMKSRLTDVVNAEDLSHATMRNIRQNLFWAFFYNVIGIPVAAGVFFPLFGWTLNPMVAAAAMSLSSVSVVSNALRLRGWKPKFKAESDIKSSTIDSVAEISTMEMAQATTENKIMRKVTMKIEGMMCPHCQASVTKGLSAIQGVSNVVVDLKAKTATMEAEDSVANQVLSDTVTELGFQVISVE